MLTLTNIFDESLKPNSISIKDNMPEFPSVEWFESVRERANNDVQFTSQGTVNCLIGVKVDDAAFTVKFEGFECTEVDSIHADELRGVDFYIDMSPTDWKELLDNIAANDGADSTHTLNTLDLTMPNGCIKSDNELRRAAFFQYHLSLQAFFDASAKVETTFS